MDEKNQKASEKTLDMDELQEKLGGISRYQLVLIAVVGILPFGTAFMSQTAVFNSAVPKFRCAVPPLDDPNLYPNLSEANISSMLMPNGDSCKRLDYNLSVCGERGDLSCLTQPTNKSITCDNGFVYDKTYYEKTTVSEWDLVCNRSTLDSLANSLYFFGMLVGSALIGPLLDWFGRRVSMLITCCFVVASGLAVSFSPSFEVYIVIRVILAMFSLPAFICYFTYAISHAILPILSMLIRDWRKLAMYLSIICTPYLIIFFFVPETPRWLLSKGRSTEAKIIVEKYAKSNKTKLLDEDWEMVVKTESDRIEATVAKKKYTIADICRPPTMRVLFIIVCYVWFASCLVFYGLILNVGRLSGHPYVNSILNAFMEVVANVLIIIVVRFFGMRVSCVMTNLLSGICCIGSMLCVQFSEDREGLLNAGRWIAILGKVFASAALQLIYLYTAEVFPTVVRGTGLATGSVVARVGSIVMPFTLQLQQTIPWLTQTIFGVLSIVGAGVCLLIPETRDSDMTATINQAEAFCRKEMKLVAYLVAETGTTKPTEESVELMKVVEISRTAEIKSSNEVVEVMDESSKSSLHDTAPCLWNSASKV